MNRRKLLRILPILGALVGSACIAGRATAQTIQYTLTWTTQGCSRNTIGEVVTRPTGAVIFNVTSPGFLINNSNRCDGNTYRLTNIAVGSLGNQTAGPIILSGALPTPFAGGQVQVVVDPVASPGTVAGISKEAPSNYTLKVRFQPSLNPSAPGVDITGPIVCDSIETFSQTNGTMTSNGRLDVTSTGPETQFLFGSIQKRTDSLPSIKVGMATGSLRVQSTGNMNGNVQVNQTSPLSTGFQVISNNGNIGGNITVGTGEITLVQANNGDIVNPAEFPSGQTWNNTPPAETFANRLTIKSPSRIRGVEARRIAAVIDADSDNSGGGRIDSIKASGTTPASSAGFWGSVNASALDRSSTTLRAIDVAGLLKANITLTGSGNVNSPIVINQFASTTTLGAVAAPISISSANTGSLTLGNLATAGSLSVSGTLGVPLTIASTASGSAVNIGVLPSAGLVRITGNHAGALNFGSTNRTTTVKGLDGQVVINAGNGTGTWSGVVRVNGATGTALAPVPNYSNLAGALGADADGGAVGVVPFKVHALASFPPTVGVVPGELRRWRSISTPEASPCTPGSYPVNVVKIEHYGADQQCQHRGRAGGYPASLRQPGHLDACGGIVVDDPGFCGVAVGHLDSAGCGGAAGADAGDPAQGVVQVNAGDAG